jgi:ABC-2 type transport system permease protein
MDIKLALRLRAVIFFNYLFPLIFFFTFATFLGRSSDKGPMVFVVTLSVTLGVMGSGFFGAGIRAIQERELGILRRYKVTPITPAPILIGSMVTGWVIFIPYIVLLLLMAHFLYQMPLPAHMLQLLVFISIGLIAFRSLGLVIAAVANTMLEGTILVHLYYVSMLLLGGATFPEERFTGVMKTIHQFVPATYLVRGMRSMMQDDKGLGQNWPAMLALVVTAVAGGVVAMKLFRWEKEEKIRGSAKLWVLAVLLPFVIMGLWHGFHK